MAEVSLRTATRTLLPSLTDLIDGAKSYGYAGSAMHWRPNYPAPSVRIAPTLSVRPNTEETTNA